MFKVISLFFCAMYLLLTICMLLAFTYTKTPRPHEVVGSGHGSHCLNERENREQWRTRFFVKNNTYKSTNVSWVPQSIKLTIFCGVVGGAIAKEPIIIIMRLGVAGSYFGSNTPLWINTHLQHCWWCSLSTLFLPPIKVYVHIYTCVFVQELGFKWWWMNL